MEGKEGKIRRLNGWLRLALSAIFVITVVGTITALIYWRRSVLSERRFNENRVNAVKVIVAALHAKDSLDAVRFERIMQKLEEEHPSRDREIQQPDSLNTLQLYEQLNKQEKK